MRLFIMAPIFFILVSSMVCEDSKPCSKEDAIRAETEASSLTNWADVYRSFRRFRHGDDGAIAEGYSSSTAHLLADSWGTVGELNRLVTQHKAFKQFVLRHIDELMSSVQARKIVGNANVHCPAHSAGLCEEITARIGAIGPV